ncbi:hypothetical protein FGO68_gene16097 [Halteria grandinella]|uniref:Uncharacterized protein n=1 Tax=Halteria grandinella TaxID=5974 RepID=A0A8J8NMS2_HALGN|nr:hypothetical protein FGO68_gene16097 [Halteria grandinella]
MREQIRQDYRFSVFMAQPRNKSAILIQYKPSIENQSPYIPPMSHQPLEELTFKEQSSHIMTPEKLICIASIDSKIVRTPQELEIAACDKDFLECAQKSCTNSLPQINEDGDLIATYSASENQQVNLVGEDQEYLGLEYLAWNCIRLKPNQSIVEEAAAQRIPSREIPFFLNCEESFDQEGLELDRQSGEVTLRGEMALGLAIESYDCHEYDDVVQIIDSEANQYDRNICLDLSYAQKHQTSSVCPVRCNIAQICGFGVSNIKQNRKFIVIDRAGQEKSLNDITSKCSSVYQQQMLHHQTYRFNSSNLSRSYQGEQSEEEMEEIPDENIYVRAIL